VDAAQALGIRVSEWLRRTGQQWKLNLGIGWILASIALLATVIVVGVPSLAWMIAAIAFAALGFAWTALSVRCAACHRRAVFWTMMHEPGHGWLQRMMSTESCPCCDDRAASRDQG
jgi:hypothetical protein